MIALITGASRGIGRAIALRLAKEHKASLFLVFHKSQEAAEAVRLACLEAGAPEVVLHPTDLANATDAAAATEACIARFGRLDVLVNNAAVTADGLALQLTDEDWQRVMHTNLDAVFYLSRSAARAMLIQRHGRIINLSSISSRRPNRGQANYAASKGGIESFTRALAVELARKGITVNAVAPGVVETDMSKRVRDLAEKELRDSIPMRRFAHPDEIAALVSFLAGDDAAYITGQVIGVDGGAGI